MIELVWSKLWMPVLGLVLLFGAFATGRYTAPFEERIVEKEKRIEVIKEQTQITQQIDIDELMKRVQKTAQRKNVRRTRVVIEKPDGTKVIKETETDRTETDSETKTETETEITEKEDRIVIKEVVKIEERVKIVEKKLRLDWGASVDVGYYLPTLWGEGLQRNLLPGDMIVGVSIDRKILGPFSLGIWANSAWGAGVQARMVW